VKEKVPFELFAGSSDFSQLEISVAKSKIHVKNLNAFIS
jgi:hypothetical protein